MATTVVRFEIHYTQYLDEDAAITASLPPFAHNPHNLLPLYRAMMLTRLFDQKAVALQRTGQLGTYASSLGQEAISVALGHVMRPEDVLLDHLPGIRRAAAAGRNHDRLAAVLGWRRTGNGL